MKNKTDPVKGSARGSGSMLSVLRKMKQYDPITFWFSLVGFITGNVAIILAIVRLFQ